MRFGFRKFSPAKRIAARTSIKRVVRHNLGFKAPRGWGWLSNPKRAAYNRAYYWTTEGLIRAVPTIIAFLLALVIAITAFVGR